MKRDNGGQAFPRAGFFGVYKDGSSESEGSTDGMTLRDYFAAKAMQGLIASNDEGAGDRLTEIPGYAYAIADAMLAARK